jgi:hypothetical protein
LSRPGKNGLAVYPAEWVIVLYESAPFDARDECPDWKLYESAFIEDCVKCTFETERLWMNTALENGHARRED